MRLYRMILYAGIWGVLLLAWPLNAQSDTCAAPPDASFSAAVWHIAQGDVYTHNRYYGQALASYDCALAVDPQNALIYAHRAFVQVALGDHDAALADFDQALSLDEGLVQAYVNRGVFYTYAGNFSLALGDLTLAYTLDPQNEQALINRAVVHAIEGNYTLALEDLDQAETLNAENAEIYATRGAVYSALAAHNYQRFQATSLDPNARLPAGTPAEFINAVDTDIRNDNYMAWLPLLQRGD